MQNNLKHWVPAPDRVQSAPIQSPLASHFICSWYLYSTIIQKESLLDALIINVPDSLPADFQIEIFTCNMCKDQWAFVCYL